MQDFNCNLSMYSYIAEFYVTKGLKLKSSKIKPIKIKIEVDKKKK